MRANVLAYVWYPLLMTAAISAFSLMVGKVPLPLALYGPIILVGALIFFLEFRFPARRDWRPRWADIRADAAFMALVQIVLPRVLAVVAVLGLARLSNHHTAHEWWPHRWPLAVQVILMVLIIDFARYWLHRACHQVDFLWRLHAVHHAPRLLYVLNVGRFHPFEKALHFLLDTVPFLLLGVAPEVIAGYFLLYSVNGFLQHCNVQLRYGWLNCFVAGAQTHRWHHARDAKLAACNFSNTTIIWDHLFGTFHLPDDKMNAPTGISDPRISAGFLREMLLPFPALFVLKERVANLVVNVVLNLRMAGLHRYDAWRLAALTRVPMRAQHLLLARILHDNRHTSFGVEHAFADIRNYQTFVTRVPVSEYENLRERVMAQLETGSPSLTTQQPVRYVRTSGTTGKAKDIPLTRPHLAALRRIHQSAVARQHGICPEAFSGAILAITSPATEGMLASDKPFGAASGILAGNTPAIVQNKFVLPASVLAIEDSEVKYLLILRLALTRPDITYIGVANPSTLLQMMRLFRANAATLLADLRNGTFFLEKRVPPATFKTLEAALRALPERARALETKAGNPETLTLGDLLPALRLIVTWTCASASIAVDELRLELGPQTRILELGYVASEFRGTITLGRSAKTGLPTLETHFFEFVERDAWDAGQPHYLTLDQIRKHVDYYLIVTTPSGLYRYFMNDLVRVTGFLHTTPLLQFMQKGRGATSITGEKLYEVQVLEAIRATMAEIGQTTLFALMLAQEHARCYHLYVETNTGSVLDPVQLAQRVDERLATLNVEYAGKRESGRLGPIQAFWLSAGTADAYKHACVRNGQREGQFKAQILHYARQFDFDLRPFLESR
ncbi:MAG: GH3 auxin-responsive promoter family protein [Pseudomonadota bacterium]